MNKQNVFALILLTIVLLAVVSVSGCIGGSDDMHLETQMIQVILSTMMIMTKMITIKTTKMIKTIKMMMTIEGFSFQLNIH